VAKLTLAFKDTVLKVVYIDAGEMLIGSDPTCKVFIDSLALQPRHASITTAKHKSILRDLSGDEGGTFVNNKKIDGEYQLVHDDEIRVGKHTLIFTTDPADELAEGDDQLDQMLEPVDEPVIISKTKAKDAWLQIMNGANVGRTISLNRTMTNLGKAGVQTAVIAHRGDGYFLSHLEGERAPLVDGKSIGDDSFKLEDGNVIQIGNVKMQFSLV
jgi:pSer/pThr/pTyr-binding forkhead associated (FHA) protein